MKTTLTALLLILLTGISIVLIFNQKPSTIQFDVSQKIITVDSVDKWSDTLLYWANTSTIALQQSWECVDPDVYNNRLRLFQKADSIYFDLLDTCKTKLSVNDYSRVVSRVVSNQIHI